MNSTTLHRHLGMGAALLVLAACGQNSFQALSSKASCVNCGTGSGQSGGGVSSKDEVWNQADIEGGLTEGQYVGIQAVRVDRAQNLILLTFPMPGFMPLPAQASFPIEGLPGGGIQVTQVQTGNSSVPVIVVTLPLEKFLHGLQTAPVKLPPGTNVPDGELPALALDYALHQIPMTVFLGPNVVGLYVKTPFDPTVYFSFPIRNKTKTKILGYLTSIPSQTNTGAGGYFMSLKVPDSIGRILDQLL